MTAPDEPVVRLTAWVHGHVQGVGFRWWTRARALELGLTGWARNCPDGRVEIVAQGPPDRCQQLVELLKSDQPPGSVRAVTSSFSAVREQLNGFLER